MPSRLRPAATVLLFLLTAAIRGDSDPVDAVMVARIREEGLQRSQVMEFEGYMADVLGARLTLSQDMARAQTWVQGQMKAMGLVNVAAEPFMDFGVTWDNEYVSVHLLEPDYQPMVGYPVAHTGSTQGRQVATAVIVDLLLKADLEKYRGTLKGKAVLVTPPAVVDLAALTNGVPRLTQQDLDARERTVIAAPRVTPRASRVIPTCSPPRRRSRSTRLRVSPPSCNAKAAGLARYAVSRARDHALTAGRAPACSPPRRLSPSRRSTTTGCIAFSPAAFR
jgi:carboxypeptidase Q